ncbi:hydroxymethylpyrimidine pyrophosphatase-like HAD family hydrolase [Paenibacillus cellulosilyticus]|uniref:Hydroxymethylpyrimidine pyrophosphatase-like HAD family hydrolase n=1 Tax=Paenibacillus cellulosilyticus TaxID=375489 RepID=A0A2V2YMF0_9BACL|nr:HAD family hydrolase [Paenibacillus cellulosilyticus]PWV94396.1 hydroxymethylpyrimidine pyrophosphatase-like HAD family hydrolase [Paenibacillus cellulosilyticus]QKS43895.1 hydrolase [Paenibacillus cellulosilyticus]
MIYASDLDQTLIFSRRSMIVSEDEPGIRIVEWIDGKSQSFMSEASIATLKSLNERLVFVPVTTRTLAQYRRIEVFQRDIVPAYAITSNGGRILIRGEEDAHWQKLVQDRLKRAACSSDEARALFAPIVQPEWVREERLCDELFYVYMVDRDKLPLEAVQERAELLAERGWEVSVQGRKVYIVPSVVNKRDAVAYIRQRHPEAPLISSGDSLLDRSLLEAADEAIAPAHGELYRIYQTTGQQGRWVFTRRSGLFAGEEITDFVQEKFDSSEQWTWGERSS